MTGDLAAHRETRDAEVGGEDGWLALIAQHLLEDGVQELEGVGRVELAGTRVTIDGEAVTLDDERVVGITGGRTVQRVVRGGRVALRVRAPGARRGFSGIPVWAEDSRYRVPATWTLLDVPREIQLAYTIGTTTPRIARGALKFTLNNVPCTLLALDEEDGLLFVPFRDATSGRESYGAGRYLWAEPPDEHGITVLDFNRAASPACAFTPHAACPIPPPENKLLVAILAGEKVMP